jgi:hypothetical protein
LAKLTRYQSEFDVINHDIPPPSTLEGRRLFPDLAKGGFYKFRL